MRDFHDRTQTFNNYKMRKLWDGKVPNQVDQIVKKLLHT